ncbi:YdhR family protein [Pseudonocardia endophytica]|nr:YdhR family protein [Pseudonocardia endophytica]
MQTFVITFRLHDMTDDGYRALRDELAPAFAELPGLLATVWLADAATGTFGGVHLFTDTGAADAFAESRLFRTVVLCPHLADLRVQRFTVDETTTRRTQPGIRIVPTGAITLWPTAGTRSG